MITENPHPAVLLVFCTFPDGTTAQRIGTALVEEQLAACVNLQVASGVLSIYRWQGKIETAVEVAAIFKTTAEVYPRLEARLQALHPYDVPEILAVPIAQGQPAYVQWVWESVSQENKDSA